MMIYKSSRVFSLRLLFCISMLFLALASLGYSQQKPSSQEAATQQEPPYIIQPNDILEIFVW